MLVWRDSSRLLAVLTLTLTLTVHSFTHETQVKRRAKGRGELQSTLRDAWKSQFGQCKFLFVVVFDPFSCCFASLGKRVSYSTGLDISTGAWALFVSVLYMFFVFFLGVVHLFRYFVLYDFVCVVLGAGGPLFVPLVHSV